MATSLSDLLIFLTPTTIDVEIMKTFERFYEGKLIVNDEEFSLFNGTLLFSSRCVEKNNTGIIEALCIDFESKTKKYNKIYELFRNIKFDRLSSLGFQYFNDLNDIITKHFNQSSSKFINGEEFLYLLKGVLTKIKYNGGNSLQKNISDCKLRDAEKYLINVLYAGCCDFNIKIIDKESKKYEIIDLIEYRKLKDKSSIHLKRDNALEFEVTGEKICFQFNNENFILSPKCDVLLEELFSSNINQFYEMVFEKIFQNFQNQISGKIIIPKNFYFFFSKFIIQILELRKKNYEDIFLLNFTLDTNTMEKSSEKNKLIKEKMKASQKLNEVKQNLLFLDKFKRDFIYWNEKYSKKYKTIDADLNNFNDKKFNFTKNSLNLLNESLFELKKAEKIQNYNIRTYEKILKICNPLSKSYKIYMNFIEFFKTNLNDLINKFKKIMEKEVSSKIEKYMNTIN